MRIATDAAIGSLIVPNITCRGILQAPGYALRAATPYYTPEDIPKAALLIGPLFARILLKIAYIVKSSLLAYS